MAKETLPRALAWIDEDEGPELNISAGEPGGSSKHGVSMTVLREWCVSKGLPPPTLDDMRAMDAKLAGEIYTERFAKPILFNDLPAGIDYRLLDISVSVGVSGSLAVLSSALKTNIPHYDNFAVSATRTANPHDLIVALGEEWLRYKRERGGWPKFGKGWRNRNKKILPRALSLLPKESTP